jgi:hypothetical protein
MPSDSTFLIKLVSFHPGTFYQFTTGLMVKLGLYVLLRHLEGEEGRIDIYKFPFMFLTYNGYGRDSVVGIG